MQAPQIIMIVLMTVAIVVALMNHGKIRTERENASTTIIGTIIQAVILYYGGFWD